MSVVVFVSLRTILELRCISRYMPRRLSLAYSSDWHGTLLVAMDFCPLTHSFAVVVVVVVVSTDQGATFTM